MHKVSELAKQLDVCSATIYNWVKEGKLLAFRMPNGGYRITDKEYERILEEGAEKGRRYKEKER